MTLNELQHLYWRAGFGISPEKAQPLLKLSRKQVVDDLFKKSKSISPLEIDLSEFDDLKIGELMKKPTDLRRFISRSIQKNRELNQEWIIKMFHTDEILREKMVLFWTNHFVCRDNNVMFTLQYNNMLRKNALGNFRDFVKAVSKEPAMLKYLNNKQNVKRSPNENFARELMELFTLGAGHYTEKDIKESARAFTGYFHNFQGEFVMRQRQHDFETKRFLGRKGNFDGDDIIDIILEKPQCAKFICEKIYRSFVNEKINPAHVKQMVAVFYPKYNIGSLMRFVFSADWFYDKTNIGTKIKSPVEFIVGMNTLIPMNFQHKNQLMVLQRLLGQVLIDPPNVAGWQGGRNWINSNSMLLRMKLPSMLLNNGYISLKRRNDFVDPLSKMVDPRIKGKNRFYVEADWHQFDKKFHKLPIQEMVNYVISGELASQTKKMMKTLATASKQDFCIQLMSLPEYQIC